MSEIPAQPDQQGGAADGATAADLGQRLIAKLIDYIILWVVYVIVFTSFLGVAAFGGGFGLSGSAFVAGLISFGLYLAYFIVLEMTTGQTLGKMLLKLRVRGASGANPSFEEALKRNGWMILGIIPVIGGLAVLAAAIFIIVTINNNTATRQGWHDQFAGGTSVVK